MIDIKSKIVLKLLCKECPNGAFKIIDAGDIISAMPNKYKVDINGLEHILTYLERQDCISIRYDDDNVYCLAVLPYGYELSESETNKEPPAKRGSILLFVLIFLLSFCASLIANIIAKFIALP